MSSVVEIETHWKDLEYGSCGIAGTCNYWHQLKCIHCLCVVLSAGKELNVSKDATTLLQSTIFFVETERPQCCTFQNFESGRRARLSDRLQAKIPNIRMSEISCLVTLPVAVLDVGHAFVFLLKRSIVGSSTSGTLLFDVLCLDLLAQRIVLLFVITG